MKNNLKIFVTILIILGVVFWAFNALYFNSSQKSKASGETMALAFNPSSVTTEANKDFSVTITAKPSINTVLRGYKTRINFDKSKLALKSITYKTGQVVQGLGQGTGQAAAINGAAFGQINLVGEIATSTGLNVTSASGVELATLVFTNLSAPGTILLISDSAFYSINSDMTLFDGWTTTQDNLTINGGGVLPSVGVTGTISSGVTVTTGATATTVPTATTIPVTGNTVLNMKLKYQGIAKKPATNSMAIKVKVIGGAITTPIEKTGTFTADDSGVWSGAIGFDTTASTLKYTVFVKGPRHLQKKVCDTAPAETSAGIYRCGLGNITLTAGANALDFSKILMLSGDIYGPDKTQDGLVNAVDISYIRNNLNKTDAATLGVCDINLDGKCDTQDYSLVINALLVKTDEQ
jgi:hypothetical protein